MTQKRRAKAGEIRVWDYDVLAYSTGWTTRVTVRDRESGAVTEHTSLSRLWALRQAVKRMPEAIHRRRTTTSTNDVIRSAPPGDLVWTPAEPQY